MSGAVLLVKEIAVPALFAAMSAIFLMIRGQVKDNSKSVKEVEHLVYSEISKTRDVITEIRVGIARLEGKIDKINGGKDGTITNNTSV